MRYASLALSASAFAPRRATAPAVLVVQGLRHAAPYSAHGPGNAFGATHRGSGTQGTASSRGPTTFMGYGWRTFPLPPHPPGPTWDPPPEVTRAGPHLPLRLLFLGAAPGPSCGLAVGPARCPVRVHRLPPCVGVGVGGGPPPRRAFFCGGPSGPRKADYHADRRCIDNAVRCGGAVGGTPFAPGPWSP